MKSGRVLEDLLKEILRQQESKRDFVADTAHIFATPGNELVLGAHKFAINDVGHEQIAAHTGIPRQYYDKMRSEDPALLANNINTWFKKYPAPRMVRTIDDTVRSFLSDRYRPLDNVDLLEAVLPPLNKMGIIVASCEVTERRLYVKVIDERIKKDLPVGWSPENKGHTRFDTLSPALVISNSEVGCGSLAVLTSVYNGGCSNLSVMKESSMRKYHIGGRHEIGEETYRMLSDRTKKLTDAALWSQIQDVVTGAFDLARFDAQVEKLKTTAQAGITGDPVKVVEVTAKKFGFTDNERGSVLRHLVAGGDLSQWGLQSAVTRAAQDLPNYDRSSEFERIGGTILELPRNEWKELAVAA